MLTALETTGTVNAQQQLQLDSDLPENTPDRVRVIVLFDDSESDIPELEWVNAVTANEALDFLNQDSEDIYTLADGKPLTDEE